MFVNFPFTPDPRFEFNQNFLWSTTLSTGGGKEKGGAVCLFLACAADVIKPLMVRLRRRHRLPVWLFRTKPNTWWNVCHRIDHFWGESKIYRKCLEKVGSHVLMLDDLREVDILQFLWIADYRHQLKEFTDQFWEMKSHTKPQITEIKILNFHIFVCKIAPPFAGKFRSICMKTKTTISRFSARPNPSNLKPLTNLYKLRAYKRQFTVCLYFLIHRKGRRSIVLKLSSIKTHSFTVNFALAPVVLHPLQYGVIYLEMVYTHNAFIVFLSLWSWFVSLLRWSLSITTISILDFLFYLYSMH